MELVNDKLVKYALARPPDKIMNVSDHVRLHILTKSDERKKDKFSKKYEPRWTTSIYKIVRRKNLKDIMKPVKYKKYN